MSIRSPLFVIAALAFMASSLAVAQDEHSTAASHILAMEKKWNDVYRRGDITGMDALLADDFIITVEDGRTFSKAGYIAQNGASAVHVELSEMSALQVRMHTSVAVVTGGYEEKGSEKGKAYEYHDRFTDVWMNSGGKWQLIASHYALRASQ